MQAYDEAFFAMWKQRKNERTIIKKSTEASNYIRNERIHKKVFSRNEA